MFNKRAQGATAHFYLMTGILAEAKERDIDIGETFLEGEDSLLINWYKYSAILIEEEHQREPQLFLSDRFEYLDELVDAFWTNFELCQGCGEEEVDADAFRLDVVRILDSYLAKNHE